MNRFVLRTPRISNRTATEWVAGNWVDLRVVTPMFRLVWSIGRGEGFVKVVIFCGGLGTRLREPGGRNLPKPLVRIGYRPILWHLMKYYAHFGHKEFILCLGYGADLIKEYFLNYDEWITNNFTISSGGRDVNLESRDISDWKISFVDTGAQTNVGQRLCAVRPYLEGEDYFLTNYADGLTDMDLNHQIASFKQSGKVGCFLAAKPSYSFHVVQYGQDNLVQDIRSVRDANVLINGGFFVFKQSIFDYIHHGEELVEEPFERLIQQRQLLAYPGQNYWCMDTFKEQTQLTEMFELGDRPWAVWENEVCLDAG
jgi:glucose-1-phosphate cytidylyltransferase